MSYSRCNVDRRKGGKIQKEWIYHSKLIQVEISLESLSKWMAVTSFVSRCLFYPPLSPSLSLYHLSFVTISISVRLQSKRSRICSTTLKWDFIDTISMDTDWIGWMQYRMLFFFLFFIHLAMSRVCIEHTLWQMWLISRNDTNDVTLIKLCT